MTEYTLENPLIELTYDHKPSWWFIAAFFGLTAIGVIGLGYLFVVLLPAWFGFKATVLLGLFLLILGNA